MNKGIYSKNHEILIKKLKLARIAAGLDQSDVAKLLEKTQSCVSKIESGQRRVDIMQLQNFAKIYKKSINFFIK